VVARRTHHPQQFDAGALQASIVGAVGERHLAPVDNALNADAIVVGMHQVMGEVVVVDAIHADLDGAQALGMRPLAVDNLVDVVVDEALGMIGMILLSLGELGDQTQRFEVVVVPIDVALQFPGLQLVGTIAVAGCPVGGDSSVLGMAFAYLVAIHEDVFELRGDRVLAEVHHVSELDTGGVPEAAREGMNVEVARTSLVVVPVDVVGIGVDDVGLADVVFPIDPQDELDVGLHTMPDIEADLAPAKIELLVEVIHPHEGTTEIPVHRHCIILCCFHGLIRRSCVVQCPSSAPAPDGPRTCRPVTSARRSSDSPGDRRLSRSPGR